MKSEAISLLLCSLIIGVLGVSQSWRPIVSSHLGASILNQEAVAYGEDQSTYHFDDASVSTQLLTQEDQDRCTLYKVAMNQQLYFEYIHYKFDMPDLKEFTLCMWTKFTNHTNDHPLFSYAVGDQPRAIFSWIANTPRSSYYMMNIDGHNLYRLNYPLRLNKWYHSCQSWNGKTGEWQIWVNDERVGRGFHNRLVGHVIKGGGIAISGQEQRQLGGGFLEGVGSPQGSGGMLGELTMLQLYNIALTAGKAHRDHKHHHAHHYEHDTSNNRPLSTTTPVPPGPPLPGHPFLTGGQINHQVKINPGVTLQIMQNGVTLRHPALPPAQVPIAFPPANPAANLLPQPTPSPNYAPIYSTSQFFGKRFPITISTAQPPLNDHSFLGGQYQNVFNDQKIFKRDSKTEEKAPETVDNFESKKFIKREARMQESDDDKEINEKEISHNADTNAKVSFVQVEEIDDTKNLKKRGLVQFSDGSLVDDSFLVSQNLNNDYFTGLQNFGVQTQRQKIKDEEREPAEGEVKLVMDVCDGCTPNPFERAVVIDWRNVPKKVYSGALWIPAVPSCKTF